MLNSSAAYKLALPRTHRREHTFTARTVDGELLAQDVPIGGGQVVARMTSRVSRVATFTAANEWFPVLPTDPLSPYHAIVEISAGLGYPTGEREVFPVFTGRVYAASRGADGLVTFRADDLAADVIAAGFEQPFNSQYGASTVDEIRRIILDAAPYSTFGPDDVIDAVVPKLTWDEDRGKALDDLAAVVEARWFALGNGSFVVRRYAYTDLSPVWNMRDGELDDSLTPSPTAPLPILTSATMTVTADDAYNSVVVVSERTDGGVPVRAVARNENSLSPAQYGGRFGKRVRQVRAQTAMAMADVQRMAIAQLDASTALSRQWNIQCVPDMTLEPGDVGVIQSRGVQDVGVIDSITYPLGADQPMSIGTRSAIAEESTV